MLFRDRYKFYPEGHLEGVRETGGFSNGIVHAFTSVTARVFLDHDAAPTYGMLDCQGSPRTSTAVRRA